jgi:hypothetical protein
LAGSCITSTTQQQGLTLTVVELDSISENIAKIGKKANEVDDLRLQVQFLKTRMSHLEKMNTSYSPALDTLMTRARASELSGYHDHHIPGSATSPTLTAQSTQRESDTSEKNGQLRLHQRYFLHAVDDWKPLQDSNLPIALQGSIPSTKPLTRLRISDLLHPTFDTNSITTQYVDGSINTKTPCNPVGPLPTEQSIDPKPCGHTTEGRWPLDDINNHDTLASLGHDKSLDTPCSAPEPDPVLDRFPPRPRRSHRRRGRSEGLRDADGVRITKSGKPDRRAGNYKYLKAYYDNLKAKQEVESQKEREIELDTDEDRDEGYGEDIQPVMEIDDLRTGTRKQLRRETLERLAGAAQAYEFGN